MLMVMLAIQVMKLMMVMIIARDGTAGCNGYVGLDYNMLIMLDYVDGHDGDKSDETNNDDNCHRVQMALLVAMVMLDWIIIC